MDTCEAISTFSADIGTGVTRVRGASGLIPPNAMHQLRREAPAEACYC